MAARKRTVINAKKEEKESRYHCALPAKLQRQGNAETTAAAAAATEDGSGSGSYNNVSGSGEARNGFSKSSEGKQGGGGKRVVWAEAAASSVCASFLDWKQAKKEGSVFSPSSPFFLRRVIYDPTPTSPPPGAAATMDANASYASSSSSSSSSFAAAGVVRRGELGGKAKGLRAKFAGKGLNWRKNPPGSHFLEGVFSLQILKDLFSSQKSERKKSFSLWIEFNPTRVSGHRWETSDSGLLPTVAVTVSSPSSVASILSPIRGIPSDPNLGRGTPTSSLTALLSWRRR
jgi:hypothetical protein